MLQSMFKRVVGVAVLAMAASGVEARSLSDLDAVHQAATQRTLVMRVAKAHIQLASGVDHANAQRALVAGIEEYDRNLEELEANSPNSTLNNRLLQLKQEWQTFKAAAQSEPSRRSVLTLLEESNNLLYQTDSLVRQWQLRLPQDRGQYNEQALQQSMLSERISLFYTAHYYGIGEPWVLEELNLSIREYEKGLNDLRTAARERGDQKSLAMLQNHWNYAKLGLKKFNDGDYVPVVISVAMESMYAQSNQLGEQFRTEDRIAMNEGRVSVGLAVNVSAE